MNSPIDIFRSRPPRLLFVMLMLSLTACAGSSGGIAPGDVICSGPLLPAARLLAPSPHATSVPRGIGRLLVDLGTSMQTPGATFEIATTTGSVLAAVPPTSVIAVPIGLPTAVPGEVDEVIAAIDVPLLPASTQISVEERGAQTTACPPLYAPSGSFTTGAT